MRIIVGRTLVTLIAGLLLVDGTLQILSPPRLVQALVEVGFTVDAGRRIAVITLSCAVLLAIPRTKLLGAVLTTGFLGGAICAHLRIGEIGSPPQLLCLALGFAMWAGLLLADQRLRALIAYSEATDPRPIADSHSSR